MKMSKLEKKFVNSQRHAQRNLKLLRPLLDQIDLDHITTVLEIGCGAGIVAATLKEKYNMNVTGTDVDPGQIEIAKKYHQENESLRFLEADASKLPFENGEFDMVLSLQVLHHIGDWRAVLEEVNRVLKPKGFFVLGDLAFSRFLTRMLRPMVKNYGLYTIDDVISAMSGNHFETVYRKGPTGLLLKHCRLVFQKAS
jgi:ubiquinone/menaquinone biosynthesis C-methylase UbiE